MSSHRKGPSRTNRAQSAVDEAERWPRSVVGCPRRREPSPLPARVRHQTREASCATTLRRMTTDVIGSFMGFFSDRGGICPPCLMQQVLGHEGYGAMRRLEQMERQGKVRVTPGTWATGQEEGQPPRRVFSPQVEGPWDAL